MLVNRTKLIKDYERINSRYKLKESEKELSALVFKHGATEKDFGIIRSKGDNALFGGYSTKKMKERLEIKSGALADYLPTVTIKAKDLINKMTNFSLESNSAIYGERDVAKEHIKKVEKRYYRVATNHS